MASKLRPIEKPNCVAIAGMPPRDLFEVREYYIVRLVSAWRDNDADTLQAAIEWIVTLTSEMRLRGGKSPEPPVQLVTL